MSVVMGSPFGFRQRVLLLFALLVGVCGGAPGATVKVATYNLESYLDQATETRPAKTEEAKAKVREAILAIRPDVLVLQEVGTLTALQELRESLKAQGLNFLFWEHVLGFDTNIHLAVFSRLPIVECRAHTNENFLLSGRRFQVGRGFVELDVQAATNFLFTVFAGHLKSKRPVPQAYEAELRLAEARLLRQKVDARFKQDPNALLVVAGDFNDSKDSPALKAIMGKFKYKLVDTRPAEPTTGNLDTQDPARALRTGDLDAPLRAGGFLHPHRLHPAQPGDGPALGYQ
jgi:endonuclease/exonuclease/phosphatase family metal-dependent hydrolase